ncbi:g2808 [Coccomyxa elongata]
MHAGTKWLSKRWGGATVLTVSDAGEQTAKELFERAVSSKKLFLRLRQPLIRPELLEDATEDVELLSSDIDSQPEPSTYDSAKRIWTDEVLARAQKLTVLAACMNTAPLVNHLQHLKHLVLCCGDFHAAFAVLPQAVSLETLCLGTLRRQQLEIDWSYSLPSVDYHHEPLALPCLMLEALPHLQSVALRDVRPHQVQLPVGCDLHLSATAYYGTTKSGDSRC